MTVVTITRRSGTIEKVRAGNEPKVALPLTDDERIVGFEMRSTLPAIDRKTTDWHWTAYIATEAKR